MELEKLRKILLNKKATTEELPFGPDALVFKVIGKIFAIVAWQKSPLSISLKCEPNHAMALRTMFPAVKPGYHLNKEHWNTVTLDGSLPDEEILEMINHSYDQVVNGLKKADRIKLENVK
ncbi:MmcQ/YjbR family DNA-binding protein [candidate division KSB1 bacterium]|nr:MmcQ/YjbR family DNA-binding protein [candidate division KSB1 bacterium]MBL7093899.1 MmcQ/YjbR family DNA-binding protein [candidate division KSB1 bacterium]